MEIKTFLSKYISKVNKRTSQKFCTWTERRERGQRQSGKFEISLSVKSATGSAQYACGLACFHHQLPSVCACEHHQCIPGPKSGSTLRLFSFPFFAPGVRSAEKMYFYCQSRKCRLGIRIEAPLPPAGSLIHPHSCRQLQ